MSLEVGERVVFLSLHWEVEDKTSEAYVELFSRS
jgi:hypothetical protein